MNKYEWLHDAVIYQVYPQSFFDTNGDGIGDLNGVEEKLPYIKDLGVNAIWLNPFFESPFLDAGYDITDYYKIAPRYGTNDDFINLCKSAHALGIKVLCDIVPGHTSIDHPWFKMSAKAERNEFTDRYIWTNSRDKTYFRMNTRDYERDGQYRCNYYAIQPSLNYGYAHPTRPWQMKPDDTACIETRDMIVNVMNFWLDLGCDGFRADMASCLVKSDYDCAETIKTWRYIREKLNETHPECVLISEWGEPDRAISAGFDIDLSVEGWHAYYASLFRYEAGGITRSGHSYFRREGKGCICDFTDGYLPLYDKVKGRGYISIPTGSHDNHRISEGRDEELLKVIYSFIFTMPGVPVLYYGDEIGMKYIPGLEKEGSKDRGGSRTPMQWKAPQNAKNCGFSSSDEPYLPTDPSADAPSVEAQLNDPDSLLNFTREMITLRLSHPALCSDGDFSLLATGYTYPLGYERRAENEMIHVLVNPADEPQEWFDAFGTADAVLAAQNASIKENTVFLDSCSFIIYTVK